MDVVLMPTSQVLAINYCATNLYPVPLERTLVFCPQVASVRNVRIYRTTTLAEPMYFSELEVFRGGETLETAWPAWPWSCCMGHPLCGWQCMHMAV